MSVACLVLAKFDVREGYTLQWHSPTSLNLSGLEAKMLPSGIHQYEATTVYLAHETQGQLLYGTACFRQINTNPSGDSDRSKVHMCSLGILMNPGDKSWPSNHYSAVGWQHAPALDQALTKYLQTNDENVLSSLYEQLTQPQLLQPPTTPSTSTSGEHPLTKLPQLLNTVGPLVFPLFKAALLRQNILIFSHSSQAASDLITAPSAKDPASCGALALVLALISVVPKDVQLQAAPLPISRNNSSSLPLYTVGLGDLDTNLMGHHPGFVATTSDEILKYQKQLYDVGVVMPSSPAETCQVISSGNINTPLRATFNDYCKFLKLYSELPPAAEADDSSSIHTSSSILSALRLGYLSSDAREKLLREPQWWFNEATSPMSWREYVWSAFAWFASAGTSARQVNDLSLGEEPEVAEGAKHEMTRLVMLVGQFHKLTRKWFLVVDEIIAEAVDASNGGKITLELTFQDVVDMELDPYSHQDLDFLTQFVLTYWGDAVEEVEIGLGIHGFFC